MTEDNKATEHVKKHALTPAMEANKWKPGQSGNPGGRPKDTLGALLKEYLGANDNEEKKAIVKELIDIAKDKSTRGQITALREIFDRHDGKVPETHKVETDIPISIVFKKVDNKEDA